MSKRKTETKPQKRSGRPCKATFDKKRAIIDAFFIAEGAEDGRILLQHGIYKRLADFDLSRKNNLYPHDFSRDPKVVEYIQTLATNNTPSSSDTALPAYVPLDIGTVLYGKNIKQQEELLRQREEYYKSVHHRAALAISSFADVARQRDVAIQQCNPAQAEVKAAKDTADALAQSLAAEKAKAKAAEKEAIKLRAYIRDHVEPAMAEAYIKDLGSRDRTELPSVAASVVMGTSSNNPAQKNANSVLHLFKKNKGDLYD